MSEASYLVELRESAPAAPERLHDLVRSLPAVRPRRTVRLRPALAAAAGVTIAVAVGAAALEGLSGSAKQRSTALPVERATAKQSRLLLPQPARQPWRDATSDKGFAPHLGARSRLQRQDVAMALRVKDLSASTQKAVRTTRRLGGFVANADYSTDTSSGNSRLTVRIPVGNLQQAIASFTQLGTILTQHISIADLQGGVDRLDKQIATARRAGNDAKATRLLRRRAALVREGTYAKVALDLTTAKPAPQHVPPSRFDRFWDTTKDILGKELIGVLYFLVVAGPFILIAALALFGERSRRRRADDRLLGETG